MTRRLIAKPETAEELKAIMRDWLYSGDCYWGDFEKAVAALIGEDA